MTVLRASIRITVSETQSLSSIASVTYSRTLGSITVPMATPETSTAEHFTPILPENPPSPASASVAPTVFGGLAIGSIVVMAIVTVSTILFTRHKRRTQYE
jgi:hypothetical protein